MIFCALLLELYVLCFVAWTIAQWLWRKRLLKVVNVFFEGVYVCYHLKNGMVLHLNQFEFPLPKDALSQATVGRNNPISSGEDFKKSSIFSIFLFSLGESVFLHTMNTSISTLLETCLVVLKKEKCFWQCWHQYLNEKQQKNTDYESALEPLAQVGKIR